jgi:tetratricopeptide (TPR) repeat protein
MLLAIHIASSLYAFPDYLPYSNELFGGPSKTYRALGDSNVGWGGGLKQLHAYLDAHHITQCWFAYSSIPDPASFGIPCKQLPTFFSMLSGRGQQPIPEQIQGPVFITAEEVTIPFWGSPEMNPYQQFVSLQPSHVVAGQVLQFDGTFPVNKVASTSRFILSAALLRQGKVDEAVAQAQAAVTLDPNSLYAHEALASAYAAQHHADDATHEYQAAVRLYMAVDPEFAKNNVAPPENPLTPSHP